MRRHVFAVLFIAGLLAVQFGCQVCPTKCCCQPTVNPQPKTATVGETSHSNRRVEATNSQSVLVR